MKKTTKWLGVVLAGSMITLTACGGKAADSNSATTPSSSAAASKEAPYELNVAFAAINGIPSNMQEVQEAINKITLANINAKVKLTPINIGSWAQRSNLMLSSNEKLDVMYVSGRYFTSYVAKSQLVKLDPLLDQNG